MILSLNGIISGKGGVVFDTNAQAFITAASITDTTQKSAINQLVLDLKSANIWTKFKAIYPFVGGSASQHRFNLKAPTTNASDFYITFTGGWTHSNIGVLPDGTSGYADTQFRMSTVYGTTVTSFHISYYSRTDSTNSFLVGVQDDNVSQQTQIYLSANKTNDEYSCLNTDANRLVVSSTSTLGHYLVSRTSSTSLKGYKNGTSVGSNTVTSTGLRANLNFLLGAFNYKNAGGTTTVYYGNKECSFATIGDGLSDAESLALYNAQNTFNTTLGR